MKILFVDTAIDGHHLSLLTLLSNHKEFASVFLLPEKPENFSYGEVYVSNYNHSDKWDVRGYLRWLMAIRNVAESEKVDAIHFVYTDAFYRFGGMGIRKFLKPWKLFITQHWMKSGLIRKKCMTSLCSRVDLTIVHTRFVYQLLRDCGIRSLEQIEYPAIVGNNATMEQSKAKKYWRLPEVPILSALGGTRHDKGLDLLLTALENVNEDFALLIAGYEVDFGLEEIMKRCERYKQKVYVFLENVTDEEFSIAALASDCIVLPYRKIFEGASGPLTYGVYHKKYLIGPDHGSLGDIIRMNHLGGTFEAEDAHSLAKAVKEFLAMGENQCDDQYLDYRDRLQEKHYLSAHINAYTRIIG